MAATTRSRRRTFSHLDIPPPKRLYLDVAERSVCASSRCRSPFLFTFHLLHDGELTVIDD